MQINNFTPYNTTYHAKDYLINGAYGSAKEKIIMLGKTIISIQVELNIDR